MRYKQRNMMTWELKIIEREYPLGGARACIDAGIRSRTKSFIRNAAHRHGIKYYPLSMMARDIGIVPPTTAQSRIDHGWDLCKALWSPSTPMNRRTRNIKLFVVDGIEDTAPGHAARLGVDPWRVQARVHKLNWPIEKALHTSKHPWLGRKCKKVAA